MNLFKGIYNLSSEDHERLFLNVKVQYIGEQFNWFIPILRALFKLNFDRKFEALMHCFSDPHKLDIRFLA